MSQTTLDPIGAVGPEVVPGTTQPRGFLTAYVLSWFGISIALSTLVGASIPKVFALADPAAKGVDLSVVAAVGGVVVMIVTPLFGRFSDRTTSRLGKRRPWILGGALVGLLGALLLAVSTQLWLVVLGWSIAQIGYGATNSAVHALLADQIPARVRARVSAAASIANALALIIGALIIAALPNDQQWTWFVIPAVVGTACSALLFFRLHDIVRTDRPAPWRWSDVLSTYWLDPRTYRDFFWAWACRLLVTMSILTVTLYLLYFLIDRLGVPTATASGVYAQILIVFTLASIVTGVLFAWISDRTGRRKAIVWVSALLSAAGLVVAVVSTDLGTFSIAMILVGAAQGAFVSVDVAMMTEVLPSFDEAGKDLGIVALSYQVPQVLVPVLAIPLLAIGGGSPNYTALFVAAVVFGMLGGLAVLPIRKVR